MHHTRKRQKKVVAEVKDQKGSKTGINEKNLFYIISTNNDLDKCNS